MHQRMVLSESRQLLRGLIPKAEIADQKKDALHKRGSVALFHVCIVLLSRLSLHIVEAIRERLKSELNTWEGSTPVTLNPNVLDNVSHALEIAL